ncbi:MAG TPA: adenylate/guanylate cyclase domain-containing protein [Chitinophagales bacterium]|nr:adenylate/guanylate cyclase domain-containing protein [Chitinophagales bacterium]
MEVHFSSGINSGRAILLPRFFIHLSSISAKKYFFTFSRLVETKLMWGPKTLGSILLFSLSFFCAAQQYPIDSLKKTIATAADDSNKVNMLIELSARYRDLSADTAIVYASEAKDLAEKINYPKGLGYALKSKGLVYNIQGNYVEALQVWKEALNVFEVNGIKVGAANMLNNIGVIYYNKGDEANALDYYLKSLKVSEEIKDTLRIATALTNIGGVYSNKPATYDKALQFHRNALLLSITIGDSELIGNSNANIGEVYVSQQKLDSALFYLKNARDMYTGSSSLPYALNVIGKIYRMKKDFALAVQYHQQAYDSAKVIDAKLDMAQALLGIAETDKEKVDYKSAIVIYKKAEEILKDIGLEESYDLEKVYLGLSSSYSELKDYNNAFKYQTLMLEVKNKIYNLEVDKKLSTKLFAFEIDKKQGEINLQQEVISRQRLVRNGLIGGITVVLLFAGVFLMQRNRISKEKKRSEELLLNILPAQTAKELMATGSAKANDFSQVTVLFTDFKGFTRMSENLSAQELVNEINHCYSSFDNIVTTYRIEKIKTIGDSYMCAGGLPEESKTHAVDTVRAALKMRDFIEEEKQRRIAEGKNYFEIRIGVNTGPVVAGIVGIKKFAYDIWGDTVNIASRMESSGEIGKVNISESTYELVKDKFNCTHRGKIQAKYKGAIDMYFVEEYLPEQNRIPHNQNHAEPAAKPEV